MQDTIYISGIDPLIAPEEVASWPLAPGWYLVAGLLLLALFFFLRRWIRKRRAKRYRVMALKQLKEISIAAGKNPGQGSIQDLNRLLKETALSVYSRTQVAGLSGEEWLGFLDHSCMKANFTDLPGKLLGNSAYMDKEKMSIPMDQWDQLLKEAETWIRKHKRTNY
jgi:Domain of unknown function (DUF4381)